MVSMQSSTEHEALVEKYIDIILRGGINLQPDQILFMMLPMRPELQTFAHVVADRAYALGAGDVVIHWQDSYLERLRALHGNEAALTHVPAGVVREIESYMEAGAGMLQIMAPDPEALAGTDPERLAKMQAALASVAQGIQQRMASGATPWSIVAIPTPAWARQVFPEKPAEEGMAELWRIIFAVSRVDQPDPMAAWVAHVHDLKAHEDYLNSMRFKRLHYRAPGTDLHVELPETHRWVSGALHSERGVDFFPNIPTEEVFTTPRRDAINGTVTSTKPLHVSGQTIERLTLTLRDGRIVEYGAERGADVLKTIIEMDEGSHYLGEVALVPITSPCNTGFPFYNILYDENAVSHIAIGHGFPFALEGGTALGEEELVARGMNTSAMHLDFMVGSDQLDIDGETTSGVIVPLMRGGLWAPNVRVS